MACLLYTVVFSLLSSWTSDGGPYVAQQLLLPRSLDVLPSRDCRESDQQSQSECIQRWACLLDNLILILRENGAVGNATNVAQQLLLAVWGPAWEQATAVDGTQCCNALTPWMQLAKSYASVFRIRPSVYRCLLEWGC